jgi:hypothetical protein
MKIIKYKRCISYNLGTEEEPQIEETFSDIEMPWNEQNEEIAKREAYNGDYEIVDDGEPEPEEQPTQLDRVEAQLAYTAMMTDTLLEG